MEITPLKFEGNEVRSAESKVSVFDALSALGVKNPRHVWKRLGKDNPELVQLATRIQVGRGQPTPFLDRPGLMQVLMAVQSRYLNKQGREILTAFRTWLAQLGDRYLAGDITLADEIIEAQTDPEATRWVIRRAHHKHSSIILNSALARHGASKRGYSYVHDTLNVAVTGMTARQLQAMRGKPTTKDNFDEQELAVHAMMQYATVNTLDQHASLGDQDCVRDVQMVARDFSPLLNKYFGGRTYPADGLLPMPV